MPGGDGVEGWSVMHVYFTVNIYRLWMEDGDLQKII